MPKITPREALELKFKCEDLRKTVTIRQYMAALLSALFDEGESFSGKRPLGSSGWECELYAPLIRAGAIKGKIVEDYPEDFDWREGQKFVQRMVAELAKP